jgi:RNA recognition motif-containing protein
MNHVGSEVDDGINLHVIKIGNIPWEVSSRDICGMIQPYLLQREPHQEWVHIPIDRGTGKTLSDLFVEIPTIYEAAAICSKLDRIIWKQRALTVTLSTYEELLSVHFNPSAMAMRQYITREDVSNIIGICRNYKVSKQRGW